jgi:hypothetical protein
VFEWQASDGVFRVDFWCKLLLIKFDNPLTSLINCSYSVTFDLSSSINDSYFDHMTLPHEMRANVSILIIITI